MPSDAAEDLQPPVTTTLANRLECLFPEGFVEQTEFGALRLFYPVPNYDSGAEMYKVLPNGIASLFSELSHLCEAHPGMRFSVTQVDMQHLYATLLRTHHTKLGLESLGGRNALPWMLREPEPHRHEHLRTAYLDTQLTMEERLARRKLYRALFSFCLAPLCASVCSSLARSFTRISRSTVNPTEGDNSAARRDKAKEKKAAKTGCAQDARKDPTKKTR